MHTIWFEKIGAACRSGLPRLGVLTFHRRMEPDNVSPEIANRTIGPYGLKDRPEEHAAQGPSARKSPLSQTFGIRFDVTAIHADALRFRPPGRAAPFAARHRSRYAPAFFRTLRQSGRSESRIEIRSRGVLPRRNQKHATSAQPELEGERPF